MNTKVAEMCQSEKAIDIFGRYTGREEHWMGSCLVIARALAKQLDGKVYGVGLYKPTAKGIYTKHFITRVNEWVIDGSGVYKFHEVVKEPWRMAHIADRRFRVYKYTSGRELSEDHVFYEEEEFQSEVDQIVKEMLNEASNHRRPSVRNGEGRC